ncbi:hypothetical protein [Deinococcus radiotolerans]|uniref:hypothetical protein n=1 Tax=Deinococcus radiotolerans TaxID=1309407 RepID=UPI001E5B64E0|nr:hypothetical protein [Deinococcus radiotolerans]
MAVQGGEVRAVRGVPGSRLAPVRAEALTEGLGHLPLQGLELTEGAGVEALTFDPLGSGPHHGDPVGGGDGFVGHWRLDQLLDGRHMTQGRNLLLHDLAGAREAGLLLPLERQGAQDGLGDLTLGARRAPQKPLHRRGQRGWADLLGHLNAADTRSLDAFGAGRALKLKHVVASETNLTIGHLAARRAPH